MYLFIYHILHRYLIESSFITLNTLQFPCSCICSVCVCVGAFLLLSSVPTSPRLVDPA